MNVTLLGAAVGGGRTVFGARDVAQARCQAGEDRVETLHGFGVTTDHHAIAALQPPDATGGADIDVMQTFHRQRLSATDVIFVHGIAAIDDHVTVFKQLTQLINRVFGGGACRQHHPHGAWLLQPGDQRLQVGNAGGALLAQAFDECFVTVVYNGGMPIEHQAPRNVTAHAA